MGVATSSSDLTPTDIDELQDSSGFTPAEIKKLYTRFRKLDRTGRGVIRREDLLKIPELDIKRDIPIVLNGVNYEDTYNGEFTQRRAVIYTLSFTAKTYLYGPMTNQGVIKTVQADLGADTEAPLARDERIVITPNPTTADSDDDFGFTTTITSFTDSKRYNPVSDTDE